MRRALSILAIFAVAAFLGGCGVKTYTHDVYADGRLANHYSVQIVENPLIDFNAKSSHLALPDGAVWELDAPEVKADPNAMTALQSIGNGLMTLGAAALKFGLGVP